MTNEVTVCKCPEPEYPCLGDLARGTMFRLPNRHSDNSVYMVTLLNSDRRGETPYIHLGTGSRYWGPNCKPVVPLPIGASVTLTRKD